MFVCYAGIFSFYTEDYSGISNLNVAADTDEGYKLKRF